MFAIAWQYLTGRAVAAAYDDRSRAEWPPHPDRVFQALVAAWGERGCDADERQALEWIERAGPPLIAAPDDVTTIDPPAVFVPMNDKLTPKQPALRVLKERRFPAAVAGDAPCALVWPDQDCGPHRPALEHLAQAMTYVGHSSALVRGWLEPSPPPPRWRPVDDSDAERHLRVPEPGRLAVLIQDFVDGNQGWQRPTPGAWSGYAPVGGPRAHRGVLSGRLLVLRRCGGAIPGLGQTLALSAALRSLLVRNASGRALELVSGHTPAGSHLEGPHVAYLPLAFIDADHADGHLLGLGLLLPRDTTPADELAVQAALASALDGDTGTLVLKLPDRRTCDFLPEDRTAPPLALRAWRWTQSARTFATATPVVLDQQPTRRHPDRDGFAAEVVARACARASLPAPAEVRITDAAALRGVPHAAAFAPLPTKQGGGRRHVHVWLRFDEPVRGPLVLGAGRYRGYGLFVPPAGEEATP